MNLDTHLSMITSKFMAHAPSHPSAIISSLISMIGDEHSLINIGAGSDASSTIVDPPPSPESPMPMAIGDHISDCDDRTYTRFGATHQASSRAQCCHRSSLRAHWMINNLDLHLQHQPPNFKTVAFTCQFVEVLPAGVRTPGLPLSASTDRPIATFGMEPPLRSCNGPVIPAQHSYS